MSLLRFGLMWGLVWLMVLGGIRQFSLAEAPPSHIAYLLPDANCPPPCWQGIRPAFVTHDDVNIQLTTLGAVTRHTDHFWELGINDIVYQVRFGTALTIAHKAASLGDLLIALGQPDYITSQFVVRINTNQTELLVQLYYEVQQVSIIVVIPPNKRLLPTLPIEVLVYDSNYFDEPYYSQAWRGFAWARQIAASQN